MAQTIKEKPTGGTPKILSKAAQAPKELAKKGMLEAGERMKDQAQQPSEETPGNYAAGKVEQGIEKAGEKARTFGKKTAGVEKKQVQNACQRGREAARTRAQERTIKGAKNAKSAASEIRQKVEKGKQTIKTAKRSVKSAKSTTKAAKQTIKTAKRTAKTSAKAAKITAKAARAAAKAAAQATKLAVKAAVKAIILMVKAVIAAIKGLIAAIAAGGWVVVLILLLIGAIAAILLSPFGIFSGGGADGTPSITEVVQTINGELNEKISSMQAGTNVSQVEVVYEGSDDGTPINNWPDVLAVFAVKTNMDMENPQDVVVMDHEKVELLRSVFWDMTEVTKRVETETVEGDAGEEGATTRQILTIYVNSKGYEEMIGFYGFNEEQIEILEEMMEPDMQQMILSMTGSTAFTQLTPEEIAEIRASLPEGLTMDREKVVMAAYSLKGKVRYFWGGKSEVVGWDSRWGTPTKVTSKGSSTTGTTRPFGLDCSGYVTWCFIQAAGTADIVPAIGHGTANQWPKTQGVAWEQALPGDLAFFAPPGGKKTNHVGIVVSNSGGKIMVAHCSSSKNDVVITEAESTGFKYIRRPAIFLGE